MRYPDAVLLDAGGTLVVMDPVAVGDALEPATGERPSPEVADRAHYSAIADLADRLQTGAEPPGGWWRWWNRRYLEACGLPATEETVDVLMAVSNVVWRRALPGALDAVGTLTAMGLRVAVVSNSNGTVRADLEATGFGPLLEFVVDSTEFGAAKPDPSIFHHALDRLGVAADRAWYVGDSYFHDVGGGAAAGLDTVVLIDPLDRHTSYVPRIDSLAALPGLLSRITS